MKISLAPRLFCWAVAAATSLPQVAAAQGGPVDLFFNVSDCGVVDQAVRVDLFAQSSGASDASVSALDVILAWDPAELTLQDSDNSSAGHAWLITGFLPDPDMINASTVDGEALFTALTSPSLPAPISTAAPLLVTTFLFELRVAGTSPRLVAMSPTAGAFAETAVYSFTTPGQAITGDISSQAQVFSCPIGDLYCDMAVPNSTGGPGQILALGSQSAAANDLVLEVSSLPLNTFGYVITSRMQDVRPFPGGSQGILCLGDPIGRGVGGVVFNTAAAGAAEITADLNAMPQPTGPVVVVPGETWNFQAWHRDANPMVTSNFTNAVSVLFE